MALRNCHRSQCGAVVPEDGSLFCWRCLGMLPLAMKLAIGWYLRHGQNLRNSAEYRALVDEAIVLLDELEREAYERRRSRRAVAAETESRER